MIGLAVFSSDGTKLGNVQSVVSAPDGKVTAIHIKSGGFLGFGGKLVSIPEGKFTRSGRERPARHDRGRGQQAAGDQRAELVALFSPSLQTGRFGGPFVVFAILSAGRYLKSSRLRGRLFDGDWPACQYGPPVAGAPTGARH